MITIINLRGVRESATIFAVPTYLFIAGIVVLLIAGIYKMATGTLLPVEIAEGELIQPAHALTLFLVLRAFSAGCTALTGVEAISNGIPAFKPPDQIMPVRR
ncbi:MAG: APC family permease [Anaerolineales bacterium]|nr:APC family permease [Anaerolineales bacterium]